MFQVNIGNKTVNNTVFAVGGSWAEMKFIANVLLSNAMDKVNIRNNLNFTQIEFYECITTARLLWKDRTHAVYLASKKPHLDHKKISMLLKHIWIHNSY